MSLSHSQIVPAAFWVGFLALGLIANSSSPEKRHGAAAPGAVKVAKSSPAGPGVGDPSLAPSMTARKP